MNVQRKNSKNANTISTESNNQDLLDLLGGIDLATSISTTTPTSVVPTSVIPTSIIPTAVTNSIGGISIIENIGNNTETSNGNDEITNIGGNIQGLNLTSNIQLPESNKIISGTPFISDSTLQNSLQVCF